VTACPYVKTFGADVFAGGWFSTNTTNCAANYQNNQTSASGDNGGILTYAKTSGSNAAGGASSQYGAFALGNIDGPASPDGFYSAGAQAGSLRVSYLSFANSVNGQWGGQFEGGSNQGHCIPDYYTSKQTNISAYPSGISVDNLGSGNYTIDASGGTYTLSLGSGTIPAGKNIALFVNGSVYINGNITYAAHNPANVPKFAIVAKGNIYIAHNVGQLTGWYIAQPSGSGALATDENDGVIWDCDDNDQANAVVATWIQSNCGSKLTINGALIAKHVNLHRINGDVATAGTGEDTLAGANGSNNVSEVINYTPDMVIGGPFFNASSSYNLDSLVSLPPVY